jgi:DNA-binding NarL/FixJ family response regulator
MKRNPLRITLIEDDDDDIFLFSMALENILIPNKLTVIKDGTDVENTISLLANSTPELIFFDLLWQYTDGLEYLEKIKSHEALKNIPCIIFSGAREELYVKKTFDAGANLYLVKPRDFSVLTAALNKVLAIDWNANFSPEYELFLLSDK